MTLRELMKMLFITLLLQKTRRYIPAEGVRLLELAI